MKESCDERFVAERLTAKTREEADKKLNLLEEKFGLSFFYVWDVERIIKETLALHGVSCLVKNAWSKLNKPMAYNAPENCILFNKDHIVRHCLNHFLPVIEGAQVISYHEIGHALDFAENPGKREAVLHWHELSREEIVRIKLENELSAWHRGGMLVPDRLKLLYEDLNHTNMRLYEKKYKSLREASFTVRNAAI